MLRKTPATCVIDVHGIGYLVYITLNTFEKLGKEEALTLYTHFIVREDAQLLYGFKSVEERAMFRLLINVSGVGPNTAMTILSGMQASELQKAILNADVDALKNIKGIGAKSAQRIIIDLKDKFKGEELIFDIFGGSNNTVRLEALTALGTLGFDRKKAERAVDTVIANAEDTLNVEELIKRSLKSL